MQTLSHLTAKFRHSKTYISFYGEADTGQRCPNTTLAQVVLMFIKNCVWTISTKVQAMMLVKFLRFFIKYSMHKMTRQR